MTECHIKVISYCLINKCYCSVFRLGVVILTNENVSHGVLINGVGHCAFKIIVNMDISKTVHPL